MNYSFRANPCVRIQLENIAAGERHPCFFCGYPIDVEKLIDCPICGLKKCPKCSKCLCSGTKEEQETLVQIHEKYCCGRDELLNFSKIEGIHGERNLINNANSALQYCSERFRAGNSYPFLKNLATGNITNPYFGHDISEWMRYAVFGLGNIPKDAKAILDIGSGHSDGPMIYVRNRPDIEYIYILDMVPSHLQCLEPPLYLIESDLLNIRYEFKNDSLDFISAFEVLEHTNKSDGIRTLSSIWEVLREQGIFALSTPNRTGMHNQTPQGIHLYEWEYNELLGELSKKFEVIATYGNRIDLDKYDRILTPNETYLFKNWRKILPNGILANLFSINHPKESFISVFVCRK